MSEEPAVTLLLAIRLDEALSQLRQRLQRSASKSVRRQRQPLSWPSAQSMRMDRQVAILEGMFRAWMPELSKPEQVNAVDVAA